MSGPTARRRVRGADPIIVGEVPQAESDMVKAAHIIAASNKEVAESYAQVAAALADFKPAADSIHSLAEAQSRLCAWIRSKWPLAFIIGFMILSRTINAAPEDVPKLLHAVASLFGGA